MFTTNAIGRAGVGRRARLAALAAGCGLAVAACGSSAGLTTSSAGSAGSGGGSGARATTNAAAPGSMAGMSMGATVKATGGIKPVPTQTLASATWQGMKIKAMAMTAIPFVVYDGTRARMIKVPRHASFHLMVMLSDARTYYPIPYASVWATFRKAGKVVYDERQWPMISEYVGPHYGNDVTLPGAGRYQLSLLVSPPVSARHVEYQHVWLKPHRVSFAFNWKPGA